MNLKNKNFIVTGGSGLIGSEIIKEIKKNNGNPINFDLKCKDEIENGSVRVDLTKDNSIEKAIEKFVLRFKKIDGLVNCGYPRTKDWGNNFENTTFLSFKKNVEYQLSQIFTISKLAIKIMKTQNQGSIVNIGSIYGTLGNDFSLYENSEINPQVTYSAIKGGLIGLNNFLTSYCGQFNIRSNIVSPGGVFDNQNKDFVKKYKSKVPLKRMAKPSDISPIVCFLLSDDSEYITGQNILVDGGFSKI